MLVLAIILFFITGLSASEFKNDYYHYSGKKIQRLKVCGERCSGTNFILHLLHRNFPELQQTGLQEFGQKHFLWWFGMPIDYEKLELLKYTEDAVELSNSDNCLFVVIVRDPYDWLRSFYLVPWHVHKDLANGSFFHFVSSEWKLGSRAFKGEGFYTEIDNFNPFTGQPFSNVLELRKYKILNYLQLGTLVDNYLFVRYEDVRDHPERFIKFVEKHFHLRKNSNFVPVDGLKGSDVPYVRKKYFPIEDGTLEFINSQIDWKTESLAGYSEQNKVD